MTLGPWYVGDTPTTSVIISLTRDKQAQQLDSFVSAAIQVYGPNGLFAWGSVPTLDTTADTVTILPPTIPFAIPGAYRIYIRLSSAIGSVETFFAGAFQVLASDAKTAWPPTLDELKTDMKIDLDDPRDDERLIQALEAAIQFVEDRRPVYRYDLLNPDQVALPSATLDHRLGTLRLAARWHLRRRSPDGMIVAGELGATRVSSGDNDIDRMLRMGRYAPMMFG